MAYFRQTDSIEDLKAQYKVLLTKFDYKNPKNAKLLEAIDKEYKQCERYAKMAPLRKAKADIERKAEQNERERQRAEYEKQQYYKSIRERSQRKYTKEECARYLQQATKALRDYAYMEVRKYVKSKCISICQTSIEGFKIQGYRKTYVSLRSQRQWNGDELLREVIETGDNLECAIVSLTNASNKESTLRQLEERLGKVYADAYIEACEKYMDSVDFARLIAAGNKQDKVNKAMKPIESFFYAITRVVGSIVFGGITGFITFGLVVTLSDLADSTAVGNMMGVIGIVLGIIVAIITIKGFNRLLTNTSDKGMSDKKVASSRVTEAESYERMLQGEQTGKTTAGIMRIILRLFGL